MPNVSRRTFLGTAAGAASLASVPAGLFGAARKKIPIAVQLYSVRKNLQADMAATLAGVKKIGYEAKKAYGKVDVLVNIAASWYCINITPWDQWKVEDWEKIYKVNVIGTWLVCKYVVPLMGTGKTRGKIINIASNIAKVTAAMLFLPYSCGKGAMYTFNMAMSRALAEKNINVNAIAPGFTASEASLAQNGADQTFAFAVSTQAINRRGEPKDMVGAAIFLASEASDFITGQCYYIDGGNVTFP